MFQGKIYFQNSILNNVIIKFNLFGKDIVVEGDKNLNRAMCGDNICFSFLDEFLWKKDINLKIGKEADERIEQEENQDKEVYCILQIQNIQIFHFNYMKSKNIKMIVIKNNEWSSNIIIPSAHFFKK